MSSLATVFFLVTLAFGQENPGYPSFSAYDSHEVDTINLENLNIVLRSPLYSKSGALPFHYNLGGNFYIFNSGGVWDIISGIGFSVDNLLGTVYAYPLSSSSTTCSNGTGTTIYRNWYVMTTDGTRHLLPPADYSDSAGCLVASFTDATIDGSGLSLTVQNGNATSVFTSGGITTRPNVQSIQGTVLRTQTAIALSSVAQQGTPTLSEQTS